MRGRLVSLVIPRFSLVSSLVSTQELLLSEPEAASVSTVPTGRVVSGFVPVDANCHGSVLVATPWRWPSPSRLPSRRRLPAQSRCPLALPVQCPCEQAIPSGSAIHRPVQQRQDPPQTGFFPHGRADRRYGRSSPPEVYEDAMCAEFFQTRADLFLNIFTKYNLSRGVQIKIQH